jgi:ankyrin repeat protein
MQVGETALHMAARYGHAELVEALVIQQVDINAQDAVSFFSQLPLA